MAKITSVLALLLSAVAAAPQAAQSSAVATTTGSSSPSSTGESSLTSEERDELFSLHEELINIPSISGDENDCADWLAEYLEGLGYEVETIPVANKTNYNVLAKPSGLEGLPEVLITSHIDTVRPKLWKSIVCTRRCC
jgi:acetylornithine deacetylase